MSACLLYSNILLTSTFSHNRSANETIRLLEHFRPEFIKPHEFKNTWNLYRTRELVRCLTIPMADVTQTINKNIALLRDEEAAVKMAMDRGQSWKGKLKITKIVYDVRPLDKPRTVCSDDACCNVQDGKKIYVRETVSNFQQRPNLLTSA